MMKNKTLLALSLGLLTLLGACMDRGTDAIDRDNEVSQLAEQQMDSIASFLSANNIDAVEDRPNRLFIRKITENTGGATPVLADVVSFYYRLSTLDGQLIDEAIEGEDAPVKALIGRYNSFEEKLPLGLETMFMRMKEGETYEFFVPSYWGYQSYSRANLIPENAMLRVVLQVEDVLKPAEERQAEDRDIQAYIAALNLGGARQLDSGVYYIQTEAGTGDQIVNNNSVAVRYEGMLADSTVFDDNLDSANPFRFTIGNGQVISGFDIGVKAMREGEKGIILIPAHQAYNPITMLPRSIIGDLLDKNRIDSRISYAEDIPPFAMLRFNIEVESVD